MARQTLHPDIPSLQAFLSRLEEANPEPASMQPLIRELEGKGLLEVALSALKRRHPHAFKEKGKGWGAIRARMEHAVQQARQTRMANWHLDNGKALLRFSYQIQSPATLLNPSATVTALASAFLAAGLPVAMGLEKSPRPQVALGHPLPLGMAGLLEWADCILRAGLSVPISHVPSLVNHHVPEGIRILGCEEIPVISSPVLDLCQEGLWRWPCPSLLLPKAVERVAEFLASDRFEIQKSGKVGGQKIQKRVNVRHHVKSASWHGEDLVLVLHLDSGAALNPQKLLSGILDIDPGEVLGLVREEVRLKADPKLADAYRFETKLSNLYEDAVLLQGWGGSQPQEDDDGTTLLGS